MKKIRFLLPAEIEMLEAAAYYETRVNNLGENFLTTIETAVSMISEQPKTWPEIGYGIQKYIIRRFPYSILYSVDSKERQVKADILDAAGTLVNFPNVRNVKALVKHKYTHRLVIENYRVLFNVFETINIISIEEVKKRNERTYS